jgi:aryl-alcohol dehydrogenase-like predicted oxidoreductase
MTGFEWLRERWLKPGNVSVLQQLMDLSKELGVQMSTLAIAWTLKNPHVTTTILGATRTEQLRENLQALDVVPLLTSEVMNRIEAIVQNKPLIE